MIRLENLTKVYRLGGQTKVVADNVTAEFPTGSTVAIGPVSECGEFGPVGLEV